jgi:hypothetical protein
MRFRLAFAALLTLAATASAFPRPRIVRAPFVPFVPHPRPVVPVPVAPVPVVPAPYVPVPPHPHPHVPVPLVPPHP